MRQIFSRNTKLMHIIAYFITLVFSVAFIVIGNQIASKNTAAVLKVNDTIHPVKATVRMIVDRTEDEYDLGGTIIKSVYVKFVARIQNEAQKGDDVMALQTIDGYMPSGLKEVEVGDKVLITENLDNPGDYAFQFVEYLRTDALIGLGIIFLALLLLFGGLKGFNTIISLTFTCLAVFLVFIPSILSGFNIYISSIIISLYVIVMSLLIINGPNKKTWVSIIGCFVGVLLSGLITVIMDYFLKLTGYVDEDSTFLAILETPNPIDLKAIIFGAIIIGAMGAIMDVAMSVASALYEVNEESQNPTFRSLLKSGFAIGRDMMGTMTNTLILAYIGSSLTVVLLLIVYTPSIINLLNREMIVVEILQALVGSTGILFTIPFTSVLAALLYSQTGRKKNIDQPLLSSTATETNEETDH